MRKFLLPLFLMLSISSIAQLGLIGHWSFNGNAIDSSSFGLNGTMNNIVPDTGYDGIPNTALRFNGTNSNITIPYNPILNVSKFSVVVLLKVNAYYSNTCQAEMIFKRGPESTYGNYGLLMFDNALDGNDCFAYDPNNFTFAGLGPSVSPTIWQYSPTIKLHKWYRTIITFDSTTYRIYVNGKLKISAQTIYGPIGTSNDGVVIGSNYSNLVNYPYWFNGVIDDMQLYNRALTDEEILQFGPIGDAINEVENNQSISISPNPTKDIINIHLPTNLKPNATITIIDAVGRIINTYPIAKDQKETALNIGYLSTGLYLLHYQDENTNQVLKLIKE